MCRKTIRTVHVVYRVRGFSCGGKVRKRDTTSGRLSGDREVEPGKGEAGQ